MRAFSKLQADQFGGFMGASCDDFNLITGFFIDLPLDLPQLGQDGVGRFVKNAGFGGMVSVAISALHQFFRCGQQGDMDANFTQMVLQLHLSRGAGQMCKIPCHQKLCV